VGFFSPRSCANFASAYPNTCSGKYPSVRVDQPIFPFGLMMLEAPRRIRGEHAHA
jgi:hypothetical protein